MAAPDRSCWLDTQQGQFRGAPGGVGRHFLDQRRGALWRVGFQGLTLETIDQASVRDRAVALSARRGRRLAEAGERVAIDEFARPDCDMFEAQTYPEWVDTS